MHRRGRPIIANGWGYDHPERTGEIRRPKCAEEGLRVRNLPGEDTHFHYITATTESMSTAHSRPGTMGQRIIPDSINPLKGKNTQTTPVTKRAKFLEPVVYTRQIRHVQLQTPKGNQLVQALFDTRSSVL